jgi:hypothetical protein
MADPGRYSKELLEQSRTGVLLLDHGYTGPDAMSRHGRAGDPM